MLQNKRIDSTHLLHVGVASLVRGVLPSTLFFNRATVYSCCDRRLISADMSLPSIFRQTT